MHPQSYRPQHLVTRRSVLAVAVLLILILLGESLGSADLTRAAADDHEQKAIDHVAAEEGIPPEQLRVVTADTSSFPLTKTDTEDYKVAADDGRTFGVSFREGTDEVIDHDAAAGQEAQAREKRSGKTSRAVHERIQANPGTRIPVAIWTKMDDASQTGRGRTKQAYDAVEAKARAARADVATETRGYGSQTKTSEAEGAPVVFAELNAGQINGLSRRPDVVAIEEIPKVDAHVDDSTTSGRFIYGWPRFRGSGATVAVHEAGGVDDVNPDVNNGTHPVVYWSDTQGNPKNIDQHPTNVAGVMASTNAWRRGGAFGADQILSANFPSYGSPASQFVASAMWAVRSDTDVINMSWGTICSNGNSDFWSRWADYVVHTYGVTIVSSSGNSSCPSGTPQYVGSPSLGWNTISVGSHFDNNNGLLEDDVLSSFSSYANPTDPVSGGTYEKPDLVAVGGQVDGSGCHGVATAKIGGGFDETCGTSFSSPDAAALVANLLARSSVVDGRLAQSAETVKALMMAGARHNIVDGVTLRSCPSSPIPNDCRDGAGAIDAYQTTRVFQANAYDNIGHVTPTSWPAGSAGDKVYNVDLKNGVPFRGVLAWNSTADCIRLGTTAQECTSDVLNADLDLHLFDPNGVVVASSASVRNAAEVIDHTPTQTGTYTLRARNFAFQADTSTYAGVAWNTDTRDNRHPLLGQTGLTLGQKSALKNTRGRASNWDTYQGPDASCVSFMGSSTGPERIYRVKTTAEGSLTATLSDISPDASGYPLTDLDVAIVSRPSGTPPQELNQNMQGCGDTAATASGLPAGTYWVVVDGFNGSLGKHKVQVDFTPTGGAAPAAQALPDRS